MKRYLSVLLVPLLAGCDLDLTDLNVSCDLDRDFYESIAAGTASTVRVIAEPGDLRVEGRPGLTEVRVTGRGCASSRVDLDQIELVVQRSGDAVRVLALVPSGTSVSAKLDLVVEVPEYMLVEIDHQEGDIDVTNVSGVGIVDDSGDILLDRIFGDVDISDDSGLIRMRDVIGDVYLSDESGEIDVQQTDGGVYIDFDGSGNVLIRDVGTDVYIIEDGSGDITVENVIGDLTVEEDTSGRITYRNIGGRVFIPR